MSRSPIPASLIPSRRNPRARALRELFQEQWEYLMWLIGASRARASQAALDAAIVEDVVAGTDPRLRAVAGYRKRLRAGARTTLNHVTRTVAALHPPVSIARARFRDDPQTGTLFSSPRAVAEACSIDPRLREFFDGPASATAAEAYFALLSTRTEKTVIGVASSGGSMLRDAMQTNVSFHDHVVVAPAGSAQQARDGLEGFLFDTIVSDIKVRIARERASAEEEGAAPGAARRYGARPALSPHTYLEILAPLLERPDELLKLRTERLVVSKLGVKLASGTCARANVVYLQELEIGDRAPKVVTLACYPRAEMLALEELEARTRQSVMPL